MKYKAQGKSNLDKIFPPHLDSSTSQLKSHPFENLLKKNLSFFLPNQTILKIDIVFCKYI